MIETAPPTKAGFVAIIGLPNAGKSSLLNRFLDTKLSIVTSAAQTTRERVVGIDTRDGAQIVFLDTPGIVDPAYLLHRSMRSIVEQTLEDADVAVLVLDGTRPAPELDDDIDQILRRRAADLVVAINKMDAAKPEQIASLQTWTSQKFDVEPILVSAASGKGVDRLRQAIREHLPDSPYLYPEDDISSQNVRFFVAELIRETIFEQYAEEVPYSAAVTIDEFREEGDPLLIRATIHLERGSQKGIVIGRKGEAIRRLGMESRRKIEAFVGRRVYLDLWIKVLPKWRKKAEELKRFGFPVPEKES